MFKRAKLRFHEPNVNGNPWKPGKTELLKYWLFDEPALADWLDSIETEGVEVICSEWQFFPRETRRVWERLTLVTCLRDPLERMVSNYCSSGGDAKWKSIERWYGTGVRRFRGLMLSQNHPNHYVRLLSGMADRPDEKLDEKALEMAIETLDRFDTVLILERPESFQLLEAYGVRGPVPHQNRRNPRRLAALSREFRLRFFEENRLDYELFRYGHELSCRQRQRREEG